MSMNPEKTRARVVENQRKLYDEALCLNARPNANIPNKNLQMPYPRAHLPTSLENQ